MGHAFSLPRAKVAPGFVQPSIRPAFALRLRRARRGWSAERRNTFVLPPSPWRALAGALITRASRLPAPHLRLFCPRVRVSWFPSGLFRAAGYNASSAAHPLVRPKPSDRLSSPASSSQSGRNAARSAPETSRCRGYKPRQQAPPPLCVRQCPAERPSRAVSVVTIGLGLNYSQGARIALADRTEWSKFPAWRMSSRTLGGRRLAH